MCVKTLTLFKWAYASGYSRQIITLSLFTSLAFKFLFLEISSSILCFVQNFVYEIKVKWFLRVLCRSWVQDVKASGEWLLKVSAPNRLDETNKRCCRNFKLQGSFLAWLVVKWFLIFNNIFNITLRRGIDSTDVK